MSRDSAEYYRRVPARQEPIKADHPRDAFRPVHSKIVVWIASTCANIAAGDNAITIQECNTHHNYCSIAKLRGRFNISMFIHDKVLHKVKLLSQAGLKRREVRTVEEIDDAAVLVS